MKLTASIGAIACAALLCGILVNAENQQSEPQQSTEQQVQSTEQQVQSTEQTVAVSNAATVTLETTIKPGRIPSFVSRSLDWLVAAQHKDGGWGGGSHANQQNRDPHGVPTDPATTSFAAMALLRADQSVTDGKYSNSIIRAIEYLVSTVEKSSEDGPKITDITGTQPQAKLGQLVDTTMTTQFLARVKTVMPNDHELYSRVDAALSKCVKKLEGSQNKDGSWNAGGGWAPVLQSSAGQTALEFAKAAGNKVDQTRLDLARKYQKDNFDAKSGKANPTAAAGVELYAFSGSQRANAADARAADEIVNIAKSQGKLESDAEVNEESLKRAGLSEKEAKKFGDAAAQNQAQIRRLADQQLLRGFGNNGGEEFVSFLLTSESMIMAGGDDWIKWNDKMQGTLEKIQNQDGSWSGHHCITSPVFCTAAVVQCLTADRDAELLVKIAQQAAGDSATRVVKFTENASKK